MRRWQVSACVLLLGASCATRHVEPLDYLPFAFEARASIGEIWVLPALAVHQPVELDERHMLGAALTLRQRRIRKQRTLELEGLPATIGQALPGEVNATLGAAWQGQFRHHAAPAEHTQRLSDAVLQRRPDIQGVLETYAQAFGRWALLTWVTEISGEPLIRRALPGEVIETPAGPVVVDLEDDPHLVSVKLGTALLSPDGEVVLRYEDRFDAVLTGQDARENAGRRLARALADEITMVWMTESGLAIQQ